MDVSRAVAGVSAQESRRRRRRHRRRRLRLWARVQPAVPLRRVPGRRVRRGDRPRVPAVLRAAHVRGGILRGGGLCGDARSRVPALQPMPRDGGPRGGRPAVPARVRPGRGGARAGVGAAAGLRGRQLPQRRRGGGAVGGGLSGLFAMPSGDVVRRRGADAVRARPLRRHGRPRHRRVQRAVRRGVLLHGRVRLADAADVRQRDGPRARVRRRRRLLPGRLVGADARRRRLLHRRQPPPGRRARRGQRDALGRGGVRAWLLLRGWGQAAVCGRPLRRPARHDGGGLQRRVRGGLVLPGRQHDAARRRVRRRARVLPGGIGGAAAAVRGSKHALGAV
mmetsp:Transcript_1158/g.3705  ORF Transcript_1158/g.3705 Transcript_1158/m.3705 type:complete len:336 (-) Transcript_1158:2880-3887(-)